MPIKEEPVRIEFQYEQEDTKGDDGVFNVEYYSETVDGKEKKYLNITPHGEDIPSTFEVNFLVEVVDFLRKKGVVEGHEEEIVAETATRLPLPSIQTSSDKIVMPDGSLLSPPKIEKAPTFFSPTNNPVPGFAKNTEASEILPLPVVGNNPAAKVISAETADPALIINRPVIRTKVGENEDTMKGLIESRKQRPVNPAKTIKRSETEDEV